VAAANKRRQERRQKLEEHLEEREMAQCTFQPKITSKAKAQKKIDEEQQQKRLIEQKQKWALRQEELRQEKLRKEFSECSWEPKFEAAEKASKAKIGKPPSCPMPDTMINKFVERQQKGREAREIARKATCLRPEDEGLNAKPAASSSTTIRRNNSLTQRPMKHEENVFSSHCTPREECTPRKFAACPPRAACSLAMQEATKNFTYEGQPSNLREVLQEELRSLVL
jgi:hypothetical protein